MVSIVFLNSISSRTCLFQVFKSNTKAKKSTTAAALLLNKTKYYGNNAHIFLNTLSFTHVIVFVRRKYIVIENRHELSVFLAKLFIPLPFENLASSRHRHGIC